MVIESRKKLKFKEIEMLLSLSLNKLPDKFPDTLQNFIKNITFTMQQN